MMLTVLQDGSRAKVDAAQVLHGAAGVLAAVLGLQQQVLWLHVPVQNTPAVKRYSSQWLRITLDMAHVTKADVLPPSEHSGGPEGQRPCLELCTRRESPVMAVTDDF